MDKKVRMTNRAITNKWFWVNLHLGVCPQMRVRLSAAPRTETSISPPSLHYVSKAMCQIALCGWVVALAVHQSLKNNSQLIECRLNEERHQPDKICHAIDAGSTPKA